MNILKKCSKKIAEKCAALVITRKRRRRRRRRGERRVSPKWGEKTRRKEFYGD
jgi:hypothetical protein